MKLLPGRHVSFSYPIPVMRAASGDFVPAEETVALWLRAWPRLLGWRPSIHWLWPRVVYLRRKSRLDLWGIDTLGSLVIVEIRIDRGEPLDVFENFVRYFAPVSVEHEWRADALREKWLWCSQHSSARDARLFQAAHCPSFVQLSCDDSYHRIQRSLELRNAVGNPLPAFVSVVASTRSHFRLSQKASKNIAFLQKHAGSERVLLRSISSKLVPQGLRIHCRTPESNDKGKSVTTPIY